jgi:predicted DNA-binding transcriptional regulator AlpA
MNIEGSMNSSPSSQDDRLIDFKETAHLLGDISERSVRRLIARGDLPRPVKVLSAPRLYRSEVFAYLEKLKTKRTNSHR